MQERVETVKVPELLAPAGGPSALNAAVRAGADAVYLGLENFNARRGAENFTLDDFQTYTDYCHLRGVKVYVTTNTLVITRELSDVLSLIENAYKKGADAFIVQDLGLAKVIADKMGAEFVHVSTQANIHSLSGLHAANAIGAKRVTLARELSSGEIENLARAAHELGMEIECFAHGAICVCYSGQCLLSSLIGARSANRGLCAQACRLPYTLLAGDSKREVSARTCSGPHLLSPKDMCTIDNLGDFARAGVDSLKIEGRMKSPEYVFAVLQVYREVIDKLAKTGEASATKEQVERLKASFSRGFTNGLLKGERGGDFMSYERPNNRGLFIGRVRSKRIFREGEIELEIETDAKIEVGDVLNVWTKHGATLLEIKDDVKTKGNKFKITTSVNCKDVREKDRVFRVRQACASFKSDFLRPRLGIEAKITMQLASPFLIEVTCPQENVSVKVEGDAVEKARTKAVTAAEVEEHFDRLGQTDFKVIAIITDLDEGVGIGFSAIHRLRNDALQALKKEIIEKNASVGAILSLAPNSSGANLSLAPFAAPQICVIATNPAMARLAKKNGADVYVPELNLKRGFSEVKGCLQSEPDQAGYPSDVNVMLPIVAHDAVGNSRENALAKEGIAKGVAKGVRLPLTCENDGATGGARHRFYCEDAASVFAAAARHAEFEIGQFFPVTNDAAIELANRLSPKAVWLSPELNLSQIKDVAKKINAEVGLFVFGRQRLMTCEHCILMSEGPCSENCTNCKRRQAPHYLKDRKDFEFPVKSDCFGRSTVYNSVDVDLSVNLGELKAAGISRFMIDSTFMDEDTLFRTISRFKEALKNPPKKRLPNTTTGHLFRGV